MIFYTKSLSNWIWNLDFWIWWLGAKFQIWNLTAFTQWFPPKKAHNKSITPDLIWSVTPVPQNKGSPGEAQLPLPLPRVRDEAHSQRRARAFPAGSGLATAARREPGLPGPPHRPAPPYTLRYPCLPPPCPGWPAQLAPCGADRKQRGQGTAGR